MREGEAPMVSVSSAPERSLRQRSERDGPLEQTQNTRERARSAWRLRLQSLAVLTVALAALVPTVGDLGVTWDEPAYRYSQVMSAQWWEQLAKVRTGQDIKELLDPFTLLYFWPYGRHGINFHPPLAGQLNLATHALFGHWMKDIPARRMASVIELR